MRKKVLILIVILLMIYTIDSEAKKDYRFYIENYSHSVKVLGLNKTVWETVNKGYELSKGIKIRTLNDGFALITLKSIFSIYMREDTVIGIDKIDFNEKIILITLNRGSIYFKALKDYSDDWNIIVDGIIAKIEIEGRQTLVKNLSSGLKVSAFDGKCIIKKNKKEFKLKTGYGTSIAIDDVRLSYFSLPDPPVADFPEDNSLITPGVNLKWTKIDGAVLYRLEIAKDKKFINMVRFSEQEQNSFNTSGLKEGKYYWRVSSINREGIEGAFFDYSSFTVQKGFSKLIIKKKEEPVSISTADKNKKEKTVIPTEDKTGTIVFGSVVLLSLIVLIII